MAYTQRKTNIYIQIQYMYNVCTYVHVYFVTFKTRLNMKLQICQVNVLDQVGKWIQKRALKQKMITIRKIYYKNVYAYKYPTTV